MNARQFRYTKTDIEQNTHRCEVCLKSVATFSIFNKETAEWEKCVAIEDAKGSQSAAAKKHPTIAAIVMLHKEITDAVTFHIVKDMVPIHIVEKDRFIQMIKTVEPIYEQSNC